MKKHVLSATLALSLLTSAVASATAFAAEEKKIVTQAGGYVTVSNVDKEIAFTDEGAGVGDTIYVASGPVKVSVSGEDPHPRISYRPEAKLVNDYMDIGEVFEAIQVTDNAAELTKPGYYSVNVRFGADYTNLNVAELMIQIVGDSETGAAAGSDAGAKPQPSEPAKPEAAKPETAAATAPASQSAAANPTASKVMVNGKEVTFEAYNIDGNNYFKLRDFAQAVNGSDKQFEVSWDNANNAISLISKKAYTQVGGELAVSAAAGSKQAASTNSKIYVDGKEVRLTAYNIDGNNYFKLRDVAQAFNIGVTWDGTANMVGIDTKADYKE
ncbi:stalk domain-containing protein [Paenibacillus chartarius]|uniref:Stalk domain-containing protein n=1 Tax=Paenibacillus chartarius TaxID=747481 RepID=A0ABV6DGN4_9BACL